MANQKAASASSRTEQSASKKAATPARDKAAEKLAEARKKNLDLAISSIQKEFGETAIMRMGDEHRVDVDVIPTGKIVGRTAWSVATTRTPISSAATAGIETYITTEVAEL